MNWFPEHVTGGVMVASQTTGGGFKDISVLSVNGDFAIKVSLLDGLQSEPKSKEVMAAYLNNYKFLPVPKMVTKHSTSPTPEDRLGLPVVVILNLRNAI